MRKGVIVILFLVLAVGGAILYLGNRKQKTGEPLSINPETKIEQREGNRVDVRDVTFPASDGYAISATYRPGRSTLKSAALILVHQYGSTRHDFDAFIPRLQGAGYTILAYDIRGFGLSQNGPADINDFPNDVRGAVEFLKKQPNVDKEKIGIIGASVGANVAFVSSGSIPGIKAAVALSPSNTGKRGVLLGREISNFSPHNIFIVSDEREKSDADFIFSLVGGKKEQKVYPGFGHGIGVLRSAEARRNIIFFLNSILK